LNFHNLGLTSQFGAYVSNKAIYFLIASSLERLPKLFHASYFALSTTFNLEGAF
jgi:hypothetical protein